MSAAFLSAGPEFLAATAPRAVSQHIARHAALVIPNSDLFDGSSGFDQVNLPILYLKSKAFFDEPAMFGIINATFLTAIVPSNSIGQIPSGALHGRNSGF